MITDSNVVSAVEHADLEACETPAKAGIAADGLDEATGDDMDCDVVPVSQVSVVYDDDIIEVLETGFSGDRLMDTDAGTGAGHSQSPADVADSICSTNDAQILPFSQEGVPLSSLSFSWEEVSQSILAPVEGPSEDLLPHTLNAEQGLLVNNQVATTCHRLSQRPEPIPVLVSFSLTLMYFNSQRLRFGRCK